MELAIDFFDICAKINLSCIRRECTTDDERNRETAGTNRKPRDEIAALMIHEKSITTIRIAKLMTDRFLFRREGGKDDYIETLRQVTYDTNLTLRRHIFFLF